MLDPSLRYEFFHGPDVVQTLADAQAHGLNCIALAHLAIEQLTGQLFAPRLNFYELFCDSEYSVTIPGAEDMEPGDLAWFGLARPRVPLEEFVPDYDGRGQLRNWRDRAVKHVAVYTGEQMGDDYGMLHISQVEYSTAVWPLQRFRQYLLYERLYRISRVK